METPKVLEELQMQLGSNRSYDQIKLLKAIRGTAIAAFSEASAKARADSTTAPFYQGKAAAYDEVVRLLMTLEAF